MTPEQRVLAGRSFLNLHARLWPTAFAPSIPAPARKRSPSGWPRDWNYNGGWSSADED